MFTRRHRKKACATNSGLQHLLVLVRTTCSGVILLTTSGLVVPRISRTERKCMAGADASIGEKCVDGPSAPPPRLPNDTSSSAASPRQPRRKEAPQMTARRCANRYLLVLFGRLPRKRRICRRGGAADEGSQHPFALALPHCSRCLLVGGWGNTAEVGKDVPRTPRPPGRHPSDFDSLQLKLSPLMSAGDGT